ncbi:MAG: hypothetical protein NTX22_07470 [Ignavibacteriales bacterium]|nr:hypothetical protein [Ignavibacteriales bacterium]
MNGKQIVIGIFENESYALIAKRDLRAVGISAYILKDGGGVFFPLLSQAEGVQLIIPDTQLEEAKKILQTKFI